MINELLENESKGNFEITSNVMYRIALMEYALELSPYNFDI